MSKWRWKKEPTPLVLAIDEIDFARSLPFDTDDFFAGIRECHNRRAHQPALKRLTFCLIGSATPNDLIQNAHITPFNVGKRVTITDFTPQEATPLADGLNSAGKDGKTLVAQILYWTNGHPYLTQKLCAAAALDREVSGAGDIDGLAKRLFLSRRASATEDVNLTFARDRLLKSDLNKDRLFGLYQAVHEEKRAIADDPRDPYCNALRLSGIVVERAGYLFVRNRIYRELFTPAWAQEQMPGIEAAQRRREVRRARWQVASIAGCIIAGMGGLAYNANQQYQRANNTASKLQLALTDTQAARNSADRYLYISNMNLIQRDYEANNIANVAALLDQTRTSPYRGFEWGYWNRLCHRELLTLKGPVKPMAFSPDGKRVAMRHDDKTVEIWDTSTVKVICTLKGCTELVQAFSIDGKKIVTGDDSKPVKIWDAATGKELLTLAGSTAPVAVSTDGKRIVTGVGHHLLTESRTLKIWDSQTGKKIFSFTGANVEPDAGINTVTFSPDGKRIVTGFDTTVGVWNATTGREIFSFKACPLNTRALVFTPETDMTIHFGRLSSVVFSPDGKRIATANGYDPASVWDAQTARKIFELKHPEGANSVAFSFDGKQVVTEGQNIEKLWDASTGKEVNVCKGFHGPLAFSHDGNCIITGSRDDTVKIWDTASREAFTFEKHKGYINSLAFFSDSKGAVTAGYDDTVRIWDVQTGKERVVLDGVSGEHGARLAGALSVAASPDGAKIALVIRGSQTPEIWDIQTKRKLLVLKGHTALFRERGNPFVYSPDGSRIVTGNPDKTARIWDSQTGKTLVVLTGHTDAINSVAFSPDGKNILTGSDDHTAKLWDVQTGKEILTFRGHTGSVGSVAFSPSGNQIVTGGDDAKIWDAHTGKEILTLKGHTASIISLAYSPDGERIVTGGSDDTAKLWDVQTGREILTFGGHHGWVSSVAFSPDGKRLMTAGYDNIVTEWLGE